MSEPTLESLQAELAAAKEAHAKELAALKQGAEAKVQSAAKIQKAFLRLQETNPQAADYLNALAQGQNPAPFWNTTPVPNPDTDDVSMEPWERAIERVQQESQAREERLLATINAQMSKILEPVGALRADSAMSKAAAQIDREWGPGSFDRIRPQLNDRANDALLAQPDGLVTLADAILGRELQSQTQNGRRAWQREQIDNVAAPQRAGRGSETLDLDGFDDTDLVGMAEALYGDRLTTLEE